MGKKNYRLRAVGVLLHQPNRLRTRRSQVHKILRPLVSCELDNPRPRHRASVFTPKIATWNKKKIVARYLCLSDVLYLYSELVKIKTENNFTIRLKFIEIFFTSFRYRIFLIVDAEYHRWFLILSVYCTQSN